ncbi:hypothetical protein D3C87_156170 [compost metagenome]|uniref:helix-turn-helix domain-containing protein n=1 Tax=Achromobacter sp. Root83 TaxID=1736602 RepID=UPI00070936A7|nr:helix-turn-helix transcriptional regulator [Achromobacter sp. Root83]KRC71751.1 DNA-binding protein [Achromobacter sp. Root83]
MSLAQRLRTLMRWRGIRSQNQLARISGVPQSCIHRILTRQEDRYSPARGTLVRLAHALDTSVPWLTDGVVPASGPARAHRVHDDPDSNGDGYCTEICTLLRQLPDSTKRKVLTVVRLIVERQDGA